MATTGGRYFGFVIGGSLPAALAANWLASAWDQNASMYVISPVTVKIEEIVMAWMVDLLRLPSGSGMGFVTGTTMANFSALAAARTALLKRAGWNVEEERAVSGVADSRRGKAGWADAYRVERVPLIAAAAEPLVLFPEQPAAERQRMRGGADSPGFLSSSSSRSGVMTGLPQWETFPAIMT